MKKTVLFFLLIIVAYIFFIPAFTVPYGNNKKTGKYYSIRGIKMYCEVYGNGSKPLLMIHGNNGSIATFSNNIAYFAQKYKVIVADSRSQGKSVDKSDSLSFEMMADDEAALLDTLHIKSAYIVGWSDGGVVALLMAIRHPDKVIKLAESGANLTPDSNAIDPKIWKQQLTRYNHDKDKPLVTDKEKNDWKLFELDWLEPNISLTEVHQIHCPSFIIGGDHDIIPVKHTIKIAQNINGAKLWIVPHSGHPTLVEHKNDFNKNIDLFFEN